jgi:hypothetical protein
MSSAPWTAVDQYITDLPIPEERAFGCRAGSLSAGGAATYEGGAQPGASASRAGPGSQPCCSAVCATSRQPRSGTVPTRTASDAQVGAARCPAPVPLPIAMAARGRLR